MFFHVFPPLSPCGEQSVQMHLEFTSVCAQGNLHPQHSFLQCLTLAEVSHPKTELANLAWCKKSCNVTAYPSVQACTSKIEAGTEENRFGFGFCFLKS